MALHSMTGFARWEGEFEGGRLVWELRSVNGKGLDLKLRLPQSAESIDLDLRRRAGAALSRGNVQASLQIVREVPVATLAVDQAFLAQILGVCDELVRSGHAAPPTADGLLSLRGVIDGRDPGVANGFDEPLRAQALAGFDAALALLKSARGEEGAAIADILARRLDEIDALVARAEADPARSPAAIAERLRRQVEALLGTGAPLDAGRLAQEAAILATRADIDEETDRLRTHVETARGLLRGGGAVGRRLDFLAQEFHRESNTICSKSNAASLTTVGLELKVVVDQFREQVQNIE